MELMETPTRRSCWKMNKRHFKEAKEQIQQIWQSQPLGAIFFTNMCKVIRFYKGQSHKISKGRSRTQTKAINIVFDLQKLV
jgi:hypothetical protein